MSSSIEETTLDQVAAQMGGKEVLGRIVGMYTGKLPTEVEGLRAALDSGDLETVQADAHRLKSSSGQLGASRLAALLADLEEAGRDRDADSAGRIMAEVTIEAERVRADLEAFAA